MEKYFRLESGGLINIVEHTIQQIEKWPNLKIYVGTDSQDHGSTHYVTAIVYRYGKRGAHYIYNYDIVPKMKDMYTRLFDEATRTISIAKIMREEIPSISFEALEFDYNKIPTFDSNKLISSVRGWAIGEGFKANFKGDEMIATRAADHLVKK